VTDSNFVAKEPCPSCGSRDNLARYDDGHAYCFTQGCGHYEPGDGEAQPQQQRSHMSGDLLPLGEARAITSRGLTEETCQKWGYTVHVSGVSGKVFQVANYRDDTGRVVAQKVRGKDKDFSVKGTITGLLYGKHLWRDAGRRVIITEGEIDALTVSQVLDHKWQVVSIPNGVQGAKKALAANVEWLNRFDQVVLCFDQDEPGRKATEECCGLFPPGKVRIVNLPLKDPNAMLVEGRTEELVRCLWDAKEYRPDGIVTVSDLVEEVLRPAEEGLPWVLSSLTEATHGRCYGELVAVGAGTGVGKTTLIAQQIAMDLSAGASVGAFLFEQSPSETVKLIAGMQAGKQFSIPGAGWKTKELKDALWKMEKAKGQLYLYDHFGACDWDIVKERIRYLRHSRDVRLFYIDHLTALAAGQEDERIALEKMMAELGSLVKELDCWILFVSHLATPEGKPHEEGGRVMIRHFKGSRAIGFWSHFMFGLERNQQDGDEEVRGTTMLRVLKARPPRACRSTGKTIELAYNHDTGLLYEPDPFTDTTPNQPDDF
jgi:twinkle protein